MKGEVVVVIRMCVVIWWWWFVALMGMNVMVAMVVMVIALVLYNTRVPASHSLIAKKFRRTQSFVTFKSAP